MKLTYYGTSAAEGFPGLFCECDTCKRARKAGGRNLRSRSQAMVNDTILIDLPPDTLYHVFAFGLPLEKVEHVILTHNHSDHLYERDLLERQCSHAWLDTERTLHIYGSEPSLNQIHACLDIPKIKDHSRWTLHGLAPFTPYTVGGHFITPLKANHDVRTDPYIYDISDGEKRMLYGNDTGYLPVETKEFLEETKPYYDLISLDCTAGLYEQQYTSHLNLRQATEVKAYLLNIGVADDKTVFVAHHFSHNCQAIYDEFVPIAAKNGFLVSYDGMSITF